MNNFTFFSFYDLFSESDDIKLELLSLAALHCSYLIKLRLEFETFLFKNSLFGIKLLDASVS